MIVITPKGNFGVYKSVEVIDGGLRCDDSILPFTVIGNDYTISPDDSLMPPAPAPAPTVPQTVTMRQAEVELLHAELLDDVEDIIATLPREAQITWKRSSVVERDNPLIRIVANSKGLTSADIDQLFINAARR